MSTEYTRDDLWEELMADGTKYCCYCGQEQRQFGCCGENHFETFADMSEDQQEEILDEAWEEANK